MNKGDYWFKFNFADWRTDPALRKCSAATRGVWIDLLCAMREAASPSVSGTIEELSRLIGCFPDEMRVAIDELERTGTADVTRAAHKSSVTCNAQVTLGNEIVTVMSRRFDREVKSKEQTRLRVQKFRAGSDVTPEKQDRVRDRVKSKSKTLSTDSLSTGTSYSRLSREPDKKNDTSDTPAKAVATNRGTRIAAKFVVTKAMREWADAETPSVDWQAETRKFVDYYRSVSGQKGVRLDWQATWRNWIRNAVKDYTAKGGNGNGRQQKRTNADRLNDIAEMVAKYQ